MKVSEIIKIIEDDGWFLIRQKGSHRQYKHQTKKGLVTIASHKISDDIAKGTLNSVLKQAKIKMKK
ncbi:MAG TPA: type II toxin-antitoxin system HicA family toxin [Bacteroidales bacterium]|nr:type II toxin-antitoxin system HicA family toxin [Bacteroidales bacterium]